MSQSNAGYIKADKNDKARRITANTVAPKKAHNSRGRSGATWQRTDKRAQYENV